ncbi:EAL domain-containing response regulator [Pseudomonas chlororaphis]|uniref:EAL domain-containing response regulator n=1 Tax=Pseudomonas chlororaphis subsp. aurantiaca TaxID=86192 RepID=A0AAJ0ZKM1_9PSED|nr:EAL domain-containing response regulator [Pseudomonas chlororaphis]MBU4634020.1 EAL domain-containing response regulator [Pseudomonas chlororaphis subsp. aurantiaca]
MSELRFLVLEDHGFQRAVVVKALHRIGHYQVLEASDGHEALQQLETQGAVDIALCDLRMMGMDGLKFLRKACEARLVRAVVIVSELAPDLRQAVEQIVALQSFQLLGSIEKPLVTQVLEKILSRYQAEQDRYLSWSTRTVPALLEQDVRQALRRQEFCAYYQPKVCLESGECIGAEVLVRWEKHDGRVLLPAEFLPVIERCSLFEVLFSQLLDQGLSLQRMIQSHGRSFRLAFNLEASQLEDERLADFIRHALQRYELPASGLMLELTEGALVKVPVVSLENMVRLRMMGCSLAIDDFGVGYSSLERLCQMPFNEIKLDIGFTRNMMQQRRYWIVIRSVLKLARELEMNVVAEGIETEAQLNCLKRLGCNVGQGYYYARPMRGVDLMVWLLGPDVTGRYQA